MKRGHGPRHGGAIPLSTSVGASRVLFPPALAHADDCSRSITSVFQVGRGSNIHSKQFAQLKKILAIPGDDPIAVGGGQQHKRNHIARRPTGAASLGASTAHTLRERCGL
jgi:hypothetical protein